LLKSFFKENLVASNLYKDLLILFFYQSELMMMINYIKEIGLFFWNTDRYLRYKNVSKQISFNFSKKKLLILDVGGGPEGLIEYVDKENCDITILDVNLKDVESVRKKGVSALVGDLAKKNNIKTNSYDVVTAVAVLEHIPPSKRAFFCNELKRIAKKQVIIQVPCGKLSEKYDKKFYNFMRFFGVDEKWTKEHIKNGLPSLKDLKYFFPKSSVIGVHNLTVWFINIILCMVPFFKIVLPGFVYLLFLRFFDKKPPFYAVVVVWNK